MAHYSHRPFRKGGEVAALALLRGAGMVEITNDVMPNPYDTLPDDSYMQSLMNAIEGGQPLNEGIFKWPAALGTAIEAVTPRLTMNAFDYSSATFSWSSSGNAVGYRMYQNSALILELPPSASTVTVGGLKPGTSYMFEFAAINQTGQVQACPPQSRWPPRLFPVADTPSPALPLQP